jgi:hypothetical protein
VGESLPGWRACSRLRPEATAPGTKKSPRRSVRKALLLLPRRVVRRSVSPHKGERTKSLNSRGGAGTKPRGCLKFEFENLTRGAFLTSPRSFAGRGRREAPGEGPGTASTQSKTYRVERPSTRSADPRVIDRIWRSASPLTRSLRGVYHRAALRADPLASASTSPRKSGARLRKSATISLVKFERCAERLSETCLP